MRIALMSTYNPGPSVHANVFPYLTELSRFCDKVVCLTNHRNISTEAIQSLFNVSDNIEVVFVPNEGFDFGMFYNYFMMNQDKDYPDELILCNQSCSVVRPFDDLFSRIDKQPDGYYGITDSYTHNDQMSDMNGWHIQSYFLALKGSIAEVIIEHIKTVGIYSNFTDVIIQYEFGLSRLAKSRGFNTGVYISADKIKDKYGLYRYDDSKIKTGSEKKVEKEKGEFNASFMYYDICMNEGSPLIKNTHIKYNMKDLLKDIQIYLANQVYEGNKKLQELSQTKTQQQK